ncbi:MSC_0619 family F1-like ATPase alpha subunit [[Mycoplasma] mobile]|uniref:ATP synthase alpha chain n=1 Tax=Mycoplasma mobile (strain ATCC 43663 / 163K / NCTC 11711) TaxID=267748 RepID=Q6KHZ3_MYCM1|nr:ATP F0F1 synthase subunit alpha [[Mycoplasma] mobile]AAT27783.1 ATP synthase alpha chain [Mycoplasma mobile 163K]
MKPIIKSIQDNIIYVEGEFNYSQSQVFLINNKIHAYLLSASVNSANLLVESEIESLKINDELDLVENSGKISTYQKFYGKIIDIFGHIKYPIEANDIIDENEEKIGTGKIFNKALGMMFRKSLNEPVQTGIASIDMLIPLGKGQRELIIGDRRTGKTSVALNTIISQKNTNTKAVYVAIGQRKTNINFIYNTLEEFDVLKNTIILEASSENLYHQFFALYVGMTHAENIAKNGDDVIIVIDDLSKHANIYREMALLINKPAGREAFPGDIFFTHSKVLERAGKFKNENWGTITALPIVETIEGDITSLISSNIISITDGQIIMSSELAASGKFPAIDIELSVSRTGSKVQNKVLSKYSKKISKTFSLYKRNLKYSEIKYNFSSEIFDILSKGEVLENLFIQKGFSNYTLTTLIIISNLVEWRILENIKDVSSVLDFINYFFDFDLTAKKIKEKIENEIEIDNELFKNFIINLINEFLFYSSNQYYFENSDSVLKINKNFIKVYFDGNSKIKEVKND